MDNLRIHNKMPVPSVPVADKTASADGFGKRLQNAVSDVNQLLHDADSAVTGVVKGDLGIHEGMLAIGKADMSLRLLLQVRNKMLEAYREISRMAF